ncbi:endolytic transglycosylase MltG [Anaerocolumna sp. AGMB13020]|uniref:endolytic transglycosylase MltG n=1 Tax=Anaerocolumna sp. AGMB13020 TaxID=3081750 RepID=UPI00295584C1|nr:endolytic transglycosylase MltG [Anaerocolumna sp. AGMB13020]WOO36670.1 endolytic transglycosylase MltG [Anaerocolumna sp. AGMB13020]
MAAKSTTSRVALKVISTILKILLNVLFYSIVIILLIKVSGMAHDFGYQVFGKVTASESPGRDTTIQIKKGESTMNIAGKLELYGVIVNKYSFFLKAKLKKYNLMPGTYELNTSMTYDEIFDILTTPHTEEESEGTGG